jgi:hypothetical protein
LIAVVFVGVAAVAVVTSVVVVVVVVAGHVGAPPLVSQKRQSWPLPPALQPTPGEVLQVGSTKHLFTPSHNSGQV